MSDVVVQPAQYTGSSPDVLGWIRGIPTPWNQGGGISAIGGIRSNAANVFADSPPVDGEVYLVTSLRIGYFSVVNLPNATTSVPVQTELSILRGPDTVFDAIDDQTASPTEAGYGYIANGVFIADLVNPIPFTVGEALKLSVGVTAGAQQISSATVSIGAQGSINPNTKLLAAVSYPSSITYNLIRPQRQ